MTMTTDKLARLDDFTRAYIECALWSTSDESTPEGGDPLDDNFSAGNLAPECLETIISDCNRFQEENATDIQGHAGRAGHDFWLTRNGHGAGFWDGDWPEDIGERLTTASEAYEEVWLYVSQ